ncbi:hypothetical protein [Streptomyces natalensis]|uniref:Uncharacterized protein n=1 Tax=Streptomyces natalensis ATCC 27448 TaxID=1240678 RepID=A0A0D7CE25_9ACTN|nr:hypothetical protein [Streptomyces natalensis]KIZ14489.1 hypothetical protein SNA_36045 [Streptomyces natalensis ATCC 27448]
MCDFTARFLMTLLSWLFPTTGRHRATPTTPQPAMPPMPDEAPEVLPPHVQERYQTIWGEESGAVRLYLVHHEAREHKRRTMGKLARASWRLKQHAEDMRRADRCLAVALATVGIDYTGPGVRDYATEGRAEYAERYENGAWGLRPWVPQWTAQAA